VQTAVRVFFDSSHANLERQLNQWLQQQAGQIEVLSISMDSNQYGHCLTLLCGLGGGPVYRGLVFFSSQHASLEADANRVLTGVADARLIAIGSNQYGHCLCVIEAAQTA